jgi:hypothetical protein
MLSYLYFLIDVCFVTGLVAMSTCMDHSEFVYISEWIRQCKQSDHANQALPVVVALFFVLMVLGQMDWMFRMSHFAANMQYAPPGSDMDALEGKVYIAAPKGRGQSDGAKPEAAITMHTVAMACKVCSVIGVLLILNYDCRYVDSHTKLVLLHYYGVFLITAGLVGFIQMIWWNLEMAQNHFNLSYDDGTDLHEHPATALQKLQERSFFALDVVLLSAVIFFFASALFLGSQDTPEMHTWSITAELVLFSVLMLQFLFLFYRCCTLQELEQAKSVFRSGEFILLVCAFSLPVVIFHAVIADDVPAPTVT